MKLVPCLLLFSACATTGSMTEPREPLPRGTANLELATTTLERSVFPRAIDPALPSVDRIAHHVRARLGDQAVATIELCVAPDGHVTKVALREETTYAPFDAAVVRDAQDWRFAAMPGAGTPGLQTCETAKVTYLAPR
jgi:TonB family protein